MDTAQIVWRHEEAQASRVARVLMDTDRMRLTWRAFVLPSALLDLIRMRRQRNLTKRNLLFTKKLAFTAARDIVRGKERALAMGAIEIKTKSILDHQKKGLYSEKIRRRQISEIQILMDYYLSLLNADGNRFEPLLRSAYPTRNKYQAFLSQLQKAEQGVIQASIGTLRKSSKRGRHQWFEKVTTAYKADREKEMASLYPEK